MNLFSIIFLFYVNIFLVVALPSSIVLNTNGISNGLIANGKTNDEFTCKTDDGRFEIPLNGKLRLGTNPCRVCTCTATGFLCEDQCETASALTTTTTETTTTTASSTPTRNNVFGTTSSSSDPFVLSSSPSTLISPSTIINGGLTTTSSSSMINPEDDIIDSICARSAGARDFAFVDCSEVYLAGKRTSGIYEIWPRTSPKSFRVFCDMDTDGGGWTVIQRRGDYNQQSNFFVTWSSYRRGFGDLTRDFWLGNEKIYALSNQNEYRLHIDMEDFNDQSRFVDYEWFFITDEPTKYTLNLGRYMSASTGGDSLSYNRGMRFTTRDQDNDQSTSSQCAENYKSGWWHTGCTLANLNGLYLRGNDSTATGVFWNNWLGAKYSLKTCAMKIRPVGFNTEMLS
ncbi:unnamed protein product [Rotaria sordida]|uniref:Fibrinogen C-terminal domain-containing protein n=1 Tax=Rotaria sordida TaxID=392033 RepID=A0A814WLS4_9BILA|nr:unnamed protein product [Rotaria sordida]CAF4122186.1 unnamed protein product [Rotaria sordida]